MQYTTILIEIAKLVGLITLFIFAAGIATEWIIRRRERSKIVPQVEYYNRKGRRVA